MNPQLSAGTNTITVFGSEAGADDVQVVIIADNGSGKTLYNETYKIPDMGFDQQIYKVPPGTYQVNVYFNNGQDVSIFNDVTVPPPSGSAPTKVNRSKGQAGYPQPALNPRKHTPPFPSGVVDNPLP
jgi:hypothetical protein